MNLKRRISIGFLTLGLILGNTLCAYANPSVTAVPSADHDDQYEISDVSPMLDELKDEGAVVVADAIKEFNENEDKSARKFLENILKDTNEKTRASAEKIRDILENSEFLSDFFDIHVADNENASSEYIRKNLDVEKSSNGKFRVTLSVPTLTDRNKSVYVIHYSKETGEWEILYPVDIDYTNKTIVVEFENFSPAAILAAITEDTDDAAAEDEKSEPAQSDQDSTGESAIADDQEESAEADEAADSQGSSEREDDDEDDDDDDDEDSSSSHDKKSSSKSPKTGLADTWMLWFAASAVLGAAAIKKH